jgi:hypothetical protein
MKVSTFQSIKVFLSNPQAQLIMYGTFDLLQMEAFS